MVVVFSVIFYSLKICQKKKKNRYLRKPKDKDTHPRGHFSTILSYIKVNLQDIWEELPSAEVA